jgi:hypothetical protein
LLLLLAGVGVVFRLVRRSNGETPVANDDNQEW